MEKKGMNTFRYSAKRGRAVFATFALLAATVLPGLAPVLVSADQITGRSVQLSTSAAGAVRATYQVQFTSIGEAAAVVVDFCSNTPLIGESCTAPAGFKLNDSTYPATVPTSGFTDENVLDANTIVVTGAVGDATEITFEITNVYNPEDAGTIYARILTYNSDTNADAYVADALVDANIVDTGSAAIAITPTIGVSAAVLEALQFCVSGDEIDADCDVDGNPEPTLELGEDVGGVVALQAGTVSTGTIYTQISTNAVNGAIVRLKSSTVGCGGLARAGAATFAAGCGIAPSLAGDIAATDSEFGVKLGSATGYSTDGVTDAAGTYQPASSAYNHSNYRMNWVSGDATGVTSTYGDPILNTNNTVANNQNMQLIFGAQINNGTPAGRYSADLSLIATGKF